MSFYLVGPYSFDANAVTSSGRAALASVGATLRSGKGSGLLEEPAAGDQPGLYVVLEAGEGQAPAIAGFWVVFSNSYLDDGTNGPPDRQPPYAGGLLDAATEEVWWKNLRVRADRRGIWRPVIVLEWPNQLASRSALAPPGQPLKHDVGAGSEADEVEDWLDPEGPTIRESVAELDDGDVEDVYAGLPKQRSLVTVIQGRLSYTKALHKGSTQLVPPGLFGQGPQGSAIEFDEWVGLSTQSLDSVEDLPAEHELGRPLELPGGRVGFPMFGWLTRSLDVWPRRPSDVKAGALTDRVVRTRWKGQVVQAVASMFMVLVLVMSLAIGVRLAAEPHPKETAVTPPPAPQPVMSVCSADHQQFVDEFRCQIKYLAASSETFVSEPVCGDPGSQQMVQSTRDDLQAAYCGLLDREKDGWTGNRIESDQLYNFGQLAAAQACFNVLGHPYTYAQPMAFGSGQMVPDPNRFLEDESLSISSLVDLVQDLSGACETYGGRVEHLDEGAVFATHVGSTLADDPSRDSEPAALRRSMLAYAVNGMPNDAEYCFMKGAEEGTGGQRYAGLCGPRDRKDDRYDSMKIWAKLGGEVPEVGEPGADVLDRYASARFGLAGQSRSPKSSSDLWSCHLTLTGMLFPTVPETVPTKWDLTVPVPREFRTNGAGVRSQIVLDAALRSFEDGQNAGVCWDLVKKRLRTYQPVHPLLAELDPDGWPSEEQQLCGQVCATAYRVSASANDGRWVTPESDLVRCLTTREPTARPDMGRGVLDRLRLPWNGSARVGWQSPSPSQICAFNLVAQDYMPSEDGSYIVGDKAPVQWAGETASGSRIAGGPDGLAAQAVSGMYRYGTASSWSVGRCGNVATECFTSVMVDVMGNPQYERYEWFDRWSEQIEKYASEQSRELAKEQPWCHPIQPYLSVQRETAQFDAPCRKGVETARRNAQWAMSHFASGLASVAGGE